MEDTYLKYFEMVSHQLKAFFFFFKFFSDAPHIMFNTIDNRQLQRHELHFPLFMDNDNGNEAISKLIILLSKYGLGQIA